VSTFFLLFFSSFFSQVIHNASKRHAKYAIENQSQRGLPRKKVVDRAGLNDSLSHVSRDIIKQGEWGYGDTNGLAKEVNEGYKKFLKKYGLESETIHKGGRPRKIVFGKGEEKPLKSKKKG
jgi:hypothetical protein